MNKKIAIVSDTNSGITFEQAKEYGIYLVAMPVIVDGNTYFEGVSISQQIFFKKLKKGATVSTSQPDLGSLIELWDFLLKTYEEIIYLPMSSGLSGSCETAKMLSREYNGRVHVVDNHRISVTLRQSVLEAKYMVSQGKSTYEIVNYLEKDALNSSIYIAVNTLEYLKQSGRVTAAGASIATVLGIKPVLQIQGEKLDSYKKVRGMKAAMQAIIEGLENDKSIRFANQKMMIRAAYSGNPETGEIWRSALEKAFPDFSVELDSLPISIACHTGDCALGVGMMKNIF